MFTFGREQIKTIGLFRALQLGDLLCAIPAVRSLRAGFPQARIVLIGLPWQKMLPGLYPEYFDAFIHFPGYPGLPEQSFDKDQFMAFKEKMKSLDADLLLQMQGSGEIVNNMLRGMANRYLAGFKPRGTESENPLLLEYPDSLAEPERHIRLMQHLGLPYQGNHLEFPITKKDREECLQFCSHAGGDYVCVHPGSRGSWRQWPPVYFARMADACYEKGFAVYVTGTEKEKQITAEVISRMQHPAADLAGKTSLGSLASLIQNAALLISNCTGVSHIASATLTRSIIISMDGEPHRWAPQNKQLHRMIDWTLTRDHDFVYRQAAGILEEWGVHSPARQVMKME